MIILKPNTTKTFINQLGFTYSMSEEIRITPEELNYLAYLEESERSVRYTGGEWSDKLIEAGYAEVYMRIKPRLISAIPIVPYIVAMLNKPLTTTKYLLRATLKGTAYLREHQGDLERRTEA